MTHHTTGTLKKNLLQLPAVCQEPGSSRGTPLPRRLPKSHLRSGPRISSWWTRGNALGTTQSSRGVWPEPTIWCCRLRRVWAPRLDDGALPTPPCAMARPETGRTTRPPEIYSISVLENYLKFFIKKNDRYKLKQITFTEILFEEFLRLFPASFVSFGGNSRLQRIHF